MDNFGQINENINDKYDLINFKVYYYYFLFRKKTIAKT